MAGLWRIGWCALRRPHGGAPRDPNPAGWSNSPTFAAGGGTARSTQVPAPIAGDLQHTFPAEPTLQVSHKTINETWSVQTGGALKRELTVHLRSGRCEFGSRPMPMETHNTIPGAVFVREQAPTVEGRIRSGICSSGRGRAYASAPSSNASARYIVLV